MNILYKNENIKVVKTADNVKITHAGVRSIYKDQSNGQRYVKCFAKWWKFPQEVEY